MKRAAIYLRVSTTDQNYDRQERELKALISNEGNTLVRVFEEKKSAVLSMDTREELTKLRELTKDDIDIIYLWDITRLSRKSKDFVNLVEEFIDKGICLYFKNENLVTLTDSGEVHPMTKLQLYILGFFAQMDAENLKAKMKSGKERSLAIGNSYTSNAPYGYYLEDKHLHINEEEAKVVRMFYDYYNDGKSLQELEYLLNSQNIPTRKGVLWSKAMIFKMIINPVYKGEPVLTNKIKDKNNKVIRTENRTFSAPAIIDRAVWDKAQNQKEKNKTYIDKGKERKSLLRGILVCGVCGKPYQTVLTGNNFVNYTCSDKRASVNTKVNCNNGGISAPYLDYICWESIKGIYEYKNFKESFMKEKEKNQKTLNDNLIQIDNYIAEKVNVSKKINRIRYGYTKGIFDTASAANSIAECNNTISKYEQLIRDLEADNIILTSKINQDFSRYKISTTTPSYEEKKAIFKELIDTAKLYSIGMYKKVIQVKLNMGYTFNICYNSNHTIKKYFIVDDNTVTFNSFIYNKDSKLIPEDVKPLIKEFEVTSNNNELFNEEVFGQYNFNSLWNIMSRYNYLKDLPNITDDDKYRHKKARS